MIRYSGNRIEGLKLDTVIELYRIDKVTDGYGGETETHVKVMDAYANIRNVSNYRQMKYNELGFGETLDITLRYTFEKFDYIKINGTKYTINQIINRNNLFDWLDITAHADSNTEIRRS